MTILLILAALVAAFAAGVVGDRVRRTRRGDRAAAVDATRRILLPFSGNEISGRALQAAVRLARAEDAVIMPAYLARVPLTLPIDAPLPLRCGEAMPLLEAIEQRATSAGVAVDARISRGRTDRDALRRLLERERVDRVIVPVPRRGVGPDHLRPEDIEWMLDRIDAEVLILRPAPEDRRTLSAAAVAGHF